MKKLSWLWIVLLTFVFGVVITQIWVKYNPRIYKFEEVISADAPKTQYCDLVNNPYKYDGKIVRVNAHLNWFHHGYFLEGANCFGEGDNARTAISFHESKREAMYNSLKQYQRPGERWNPLEIIAVGVFKYEKSGGFSDSIEDRTSLHFEIYEIEYSAR